MRQAQKEWWKKREGSHSATAARQQESVSVRQQLKLIRAQNAQALEAIRTAEAQARKVLLGLLCSCRRLSPGFAVPPLLPETPLCS